MARILVIDDDAAIVNLLRLRLAEWGHQVLSAMDATSGVMLATREKPDLITLDFKMPAGDGAKVYERLRGNTFTLKAKIIFISAMSEQDLRQAIPADPDVRFLRKPLEGDVLKRMIAELLGGPSPSAVLPAPRAADPKPPAIDGGTLDGKLP